MRYVMLTALITLSQLCLPVQAATPDPRQVTVAILMFDGVQIIDFAAPYEVFGQAGFSVYTVSKDGKPVTAWMNLKTGVDYSFESAPPADIVVVPGGHIVDVQHDEATLAWIRKSAEPADHVLSVCTGSFILAGTGLLDGKSATTFHKAFNGMATHFPAVKVVRDQRWVDNGKLVTSAGLASGIDAALHVVAEVRGLNVAKSVAMHLEYDWSPEQGFVRGRMADTYTRLPASFNLPEGTRIEPVLANGDQQYWETEFAVESPLAPEALLAHIREQAKADRALEVAKASDARHVTWEYRSELGGRWRLSVEAVPGDTKDHYALVTRLKAL